MGRHTNALHSLHVCVFAHAHLITTLTALIQFKVSGELSVFSYAALRCGLVVVGIAVVGCRA